MEKSLYVLPILLKHTHTRHSEPRGPYTSSAIMFSTCILMWRKHSGVVKPVYVIYFLAPLSRVHGSRCANYQKVIFPSTRDWSRTHAHTHNASSMTNLISSVLSTWPKYTLLTFFFFLVIRHGTEKDGEIAHCSVRKRSAYYTACCYTPVNGVNRINRVESVNSSAVWDP